MLAIIKWVILMAMEGSCSCEHHGPIVIASDVHICLSMFKMSHDIHARQYAKAYQAVLTTCSDY